VYRRGSDEFGRVLAFSDGIFAIAMTLLVIAITVPKIADADSVKDLADALGDQPEAYISFFISFAVIGRYWIAHHQFFALLARMDVRLVWVNLLYLGFVAFLPFPTDLLGTYFDNPLSVGIYAISVAVVSGLEVLLLKCANDSGLFQREMPPQIYRWAVYLSFTPVLFFIASVPVAFLSTTLAVLLWLGPVPFAIMTRRRKPEGFDEYFSDQDRMQRSGPAGG
jgi:uncharacterized membrane protein